MDWTSIILAALTGGAVIKLLDVLAVKLGLRSKDTDVALNVLDRRILKLNQRVDKYEKRISDMEDEREVANKKLMDASAALSAKEGRIKALEKQITELKHENKTLKQELQKRTAEVDALRATVAEMASRISELESSAKLECR